jgi:hypothetical protein
MATGTALLTATRTSFESVAEIARGTLQWGVSSESASAASDARPLDLLLDAGSHGSLDLLFDIR